MAPKRDAANLWRTHNAGRKGQSDRNAGAGRPPAGGVPALSGVSLPFDLESHQAAEEEKWKVCVGRLECRLVETPKAAAENARSSDAQPNGHRGFGSPAMSGDLDPC